MNRPRAKLFLGIATSGGVQQGTAFVLGPRPTPSISPAHLSGRRCALDECRRLDAALASALKTLTPYRANLDCGTVERELFEAHLLMLSDPIFHKQAQHYIKKQGASAEAAIQQLISGWKTKLALTPNPYLRGRTSDFDFVERTLLAHLANEAQPAAVVPLGAIVFARTLDPVNIALLSHYRAGGLVLEEGGVTAHAAIVARALKIPAVMGVLAVVEAIRPGDWVTVDGDRGSVLLGSPKYTTKRSRQAQSNLREISSKILPSRARPTTTTRDGFEITLLATADRLDSASEAVKIGADGIGLFRTEFFLSDPQNLSEQMQLEVYRELAIRAAGKPLTIRLFDLGGDKNFGTVSAQAGSNPALGERGVRLALRERKMLLAQLRALLQLDPEIPLQILVPMVTSAEELQEVHLLIAAARLEVEKRQGIRCRDLVLGAMLEVPSTAMTMDALAREAEFFAVGANDLLHYFFAIDRNNPRVRHLYRPHHPAACRLFKLIIEEAERLRRPLRLCGEAAGDLRLTALLLGLGFRSLCVESQKIGQLRHIIAKINLSRVKALATQACLETSPKGVAKLFNLKLG